MNWSNYDLNYKFYGQPQGCSAMVVLIVGIVCLLLMGCKHIEYIPVETTHTIEHHHRDSIIEHDTVISQKETTIMQLDSEAMAQYGIRLQAAEKAWLVRTAELEKQLHNMQKTKTDTLLKIDSIPIPYPVEVVKVKHHWGGWIAFIVTIVAIGAIVIKRMRN
jgi:hypothetical protein